MASIAEPMISNSSVASNASVAVVNTSDDSSGATVGYLPACCLLKQVQRNRSIPLQLKLVGG